MDSLTQIQGREDCYRILEDGSSNDNSLQMVESRKRTNSAFLIVLAVCVVVLLPFLGYTLSYSDINRLKGYDECGNICGQENVKDYRWDCTGKDMTLKPIYSYKSCGELKDTLLSRNEINGEILFNFLRKASWKVILVSFIPLALCLVTIILFRYTPAVAVWSILILSWLVLSIGLSAPTLIALFPLGVPLSILVMVKLWVLFFSRAKIRHVTALLGEASRAVFEVKMMSYIAIGALPVLIVILLLYTTIMFYSITAGKVTRTPRGFIGYYSGNSYEQRVASYEMSYDFDGLMVTTIVLTSIITFWMVQFVAAAQDMTVSGTVAKWYTAKSRNHLVNDFVPSGLRPTLNYHLGTVALGSAVKTIMFIPRVVVVTIAHIVGKNEYSMKCLSSFFTNKVYIGTAIFGTSFIESGKNMKKVLEMCNGNTKEIVSFGNSVIVLAQILIISISTLAAFLSLYFATGSYSTYIFYFTLVEFGVAVICTHTILGTLKVSANTLFFCATEELLRNKEADLPYTMSKSEFFEGCNKLFIQKVQSTHMSNTRENSFYIKMFVGVFVSMTFALVLVAYFI